MTGRSSPLLCIHGLETDEPSSPLETTGQSSLVHGAEINQGLREMMINDRRHSRTVCLKNYGVEMFVRHFESTPYMSTKVLRSSPVELLTSPGTKNQTFHVVWNTWLPAQRACFYLLRLTVGSRTCRLPFSFQCSFEATYHIPCAKHRDIRLKTREAMKRLHSVRWMTR